MAKYEFDRGFRLKLLALCLDNEWMAKYGNFIVQPEYFELEDEERVAKAILDYRAKYKRSPDLQDTIALAGIDYKELVVKVHKGCASWDLQLASDLAIQFAREQAAKLAILEGVDDIQSDNIQAAIDRLKTAFAVGTELEMPGIDVVEDVGTWLYDYWKDKVPTGWTHVDQILEGGISKGELGIIMAPQNQGKSMSLVNIGYGGASAFSGVDVAHFSHEMREQQVAKRYAARISFRFPKREDDLDEYAAEFVERARKLLRGRIRIIRRRKKMTVPDIDAELDRLESNDFHPQLVIDDYPDLLESTRRYKDRRFELSSVYSDLRDLAESRNVAMWGASQSNRASFRKEVITLEDVAEDIGKAGIADVVISMCRTKEEEDTELCRLYMAKVRDGQNHDTVRAKFYKGQQAIVTTGLVVHKDRREQHV